MGNALYNEWLNQKDLDPTLRQELKKMSKVEIEDAFYQNLSFGTGGMRGIIGAGTNRLNLYTIRRANNGLAKYLLETFKEEVTRGVVIAHDNRFMSREFAIESARVLGAYGIKCYLFDALRPTPELSFAVRYLNAISGIVVTASHNPPNYNGYKIYDEYGCQYTLDYAEKISSLVEETTDLFSIPVAEVSALEESGLLEYIGEAIDNEYLANVKTVQVHPEQEKKVKIVFTPLHGTSAELGLRLLQETGYDVTVVEEQMVHDPMFPTVKSPNPENASAFEMATKLGHEVGADILIATDPDADRLGIAVKNGSEYLYLTGNQTGAILIYYLLNEKKKLGLLPAKGKLFNTIVTSDLGAKIGRSFGYEVVSTLTGFKFIGEQARFLESTDYEFIFGYEESYGYVIKDFVRDKDSLQALLLASEAANYYLTTENKNLYEKLLDIYATYGVHREYLKNIDLAGRTGQERIARIVEHFRNAVVTEVSGIKVAIKEDYQHSKRYQLNNNLVTQLVLPKSNVVKFILTNGSWFVLRPSGTEPKLKIYVGVTDSTIELADKQIEGILADIMQVVDNVK